MSFNLSLQPISIRLSKFYSYGLSILGFEFNNSQYALGFNITKQIYDEKDEWELRLFMYGKLKVFVLKTIPKTHWIHTTCGSPVRHVHEDSDFWCPKCDDDYIKYEVKKIEV